MLSLFIGLLFVVYTITATVGLYGRLTGTKEQFQNGMNEIRLAISGIGGINKADLNVVITSHFILFVILVAIFNFAWPTPSLFIWVVIHSICVYETNQSFNNISKYINGEIDVIDFEETRSSWLQVVNGLIVSSGLLFTLLKVAG